MMGLGILPGISTGRAAMTEPDSTGQIEGFPDGAKIHFEIIRLDGQPENGTSKLSRPILWSCKAYSNYSIISRRIPKFCNVCLFVIVMGWNPLDLLHDLA